MIKRTIIAFLGVSLFPLITFAAWWNPATWVAQAPVPVPTEATSAPVIIYVPVEPTSTPSCTPEVVTKTATVDVTDPAQATRIADLEAQVAALTTDLAAESAEKATPSVPPVIKTISSNDAQVQAIKTEIAELDGIADQINNVSSGNGTRQDVISALNAAVDLNGRHLFTTTSFLPYSATSDATGNLVSIPIDLSAVLSSVEEMENGFDVQLEAAEAVQ